MLYEEYDEKGNTITRISGYDDGKVSEAIKNHKSPKNNRFTSTIELEPRFIRKEITNVHTTNVNFSKPEVQKMFVGHEEELRRAVGRSINEKNVSAMFGVNDIVRLFEGHSDDLRNIIGNSLTSRNVNIDRFSIEDIKRIYKNDDEKMKSLIERRIAIEEEQVKEIKSKNTKSTITTLGLIGVLGLAVYSMFKTVKSF